MSVQADYKSKHTEGWYRNTTLRYFKRFVKTNFALVSSFSNSLIELKNESKVHMQITPIKEENAIEVSLSCNEEDSDKIEKLALLIEGMYAELKE